MPNIDTVVCDLKKNLLEPLKTKIETQSTAETQTNTNRAEPSGIFSNHPHPIGELSSRYPERM